MEHLVDDHASRWEGIPPDVRARISAHMPFQPSRYMGNILVWRSQHVSVRIDYKDSWNGSAQVLRISAANCDKEITRLRNIPFEEAFLWLKADLV